MDNNGIFQDNAPKLSPDGRKPLDAAALVLGIVALVAGFLIPIVSYVCGIVGLVLANDHREEKNTVPAVVICILGLVVAVVCHIYSAIYLIKTLDAIFNS